MSDGRGTVLSWRSVGVSLLMAGVPMAAHAGAEQLFTFDIKAGPLEQALNAYMLQSHRQVLYPSDAVANRVAPAFHGRMGPDEALKRLLLNTGIEARVGATGVVTLKKRSSPRSDASRASAPVAVAEPATFEVANLAPPPAASPPPTAPTEASAVAEVVVTGTNIRGVRAGASPLITLSRDAIDRSGYATVAEALNALPQAFNGAATPASFLSGSDRLGTNTTASTGINLRGLGATSTLVLVDGRRMAGTGLQGDFADVSAIPTAIVDRVDVLLDGASALYGSDAVGGVVNIILRKNLEGWETRGRLGVASDGAAFERQASQTFGHGWGAGHVLVSYEFYARDALASSDRPFTASADLRPLGGTDHRLFYSHPGNILAVDPATGAITPAYAVPPGQNGTGLTPASFVPNTENLENQRDGVDTLPDQKRESVYLAGSQALGPRVDISGDLRFTRRTFAFNAQQPLAILNVTPRNPYYVSPHDASSELVGYSFQDELGPLRQIGSSQSFGGSLGADVDLGRQWRAELYGASAIEAGRRLALHRVNTGLVSEALGTSADNPATAFNTGVDGFFNPFGDGGANDAAVLNFIGSGYLGVQQHSEVHSLNAKIDGPLYDLPGGQAKLALGGQLRWESFRDGTTYLSSTAQPVAQSDGPYSRRVGAVFAEAFIPLVGPSNAFSGARSLALSLAGRFESYSDVGVTTNPKIGLIWQPVEDVTVKASYGTSFRAPTLTDVFSATDVGPDFLPKNGVDTLVLDLIGGNRDLKPERATSWTTTLDYRPSRFPGMALEGSFFDTNFTDRIGQPVNDDIFNALSNPALAPFVHTLDSTSSADLAKVNALLAESTSGSASLFPASAYAAIVDIRYVNTGGLHVQGVDFNASYTFTKKDDRFDIALGGSYLLKYDVRVTPAAAAVDELDLANQPVDLKGQASAGWTRGPLSATATLRYTDSYHDDAGRPIKSWLRTDLQARWTSSASTGPAAGLTVSASIQNLFDQDPPFYDSTLGIGYDPANADPLGRVLSLQIQKRW